MILLKSEDELRRMREAGLLVARAHELVAAAVRPGVTTASLDRLVEDFLRQQNAVPAFKGYHGYPASICTSIDDVVVHGIPGETTVLAEGSIIGIDIGAVVNGFHGDSAWTYPVGEIAAEAQALLDTTEQALYCGVEQACIGNRLSDISHAIEAHVHSCGFTVVRDFVGHGIGRKMHEEPQIPNFGPPGRGPRLKAGMTFALEPMVNAGGYGIQVLSDNWTAVTVDGSLSAHFEHTIAITETGPVVLTVLQEG